MKRLAFVAILGVGLLGPANAFAQDEDPMGDPMEEPADDGMGDPMDDGMGDDGMADDGMADDGMADDGMGDTPTVGGEAPKKVWFDAVGLVQIPIASDQYTEGAGIGIGVLGGANYALSPKLALAGHAGLIYHLPKNDITLMEIPLLVGARFMVTPNIGLGADTGINIMRVSFMDFSETETRIPLALHGSYVMPNKLFFGAGLWIPNLLLGEEGEDTWMGITAFAGKGF